ncbi:hypothetical protein NM962_22620 [Mycobacterium sp. SVM_VP21]|nr:hypothetical protein NM962_22620 [Mycobacterium sp. SVM_VP21]
MADFKFNSDFFESLSKGFRVPLDGTEHDAIHSVRQQLRDMGLTVDDAEIARIVHEARSGALASPDMWELIQPSNAQTFLRNPSDANRYSVVVRSPTIRNSEHEASFAVVHSRAQVKLDTFSAMGVDKTFDITWHNQQDESDDPQNWSTELY